MANIWITRESSHRIWMQAKNSETDPCLLPIALDHINMVTAREDVTYW